MPIPAAVLFGGAFLLALFIARRDRLGFKDTLLVIIGMRQYEKGRLVSLAILAIFVAPLGLWLWFYEQCQTAHL